MRKTVVSKEILLPFILITSLFSLWGFARYRSYGSAFKVLELSNSQPQTQMAFYEIFLYGSTSWCCEKYSYKVGVLMNLRFML